MDLLELLERNSDRGKQRLVKVNITLDNLQLLSLEQQCPGLNLSAFFRAVIDKTLEQINESDWINAYLDKAEVKKENGETKTQ